MSAPGRELLDYIVAHIDDDEPRIVYAAWLEEHGHALRAEFVRIQVERARLPAWHGAQLMLRHRERQLLAAHGEEWLAEMPAIPGARWEGFRRGVVAELSFESYEAMRENAHACRTVAPVEAVTVHWPRRRDASQLEQPIPELRELKLTGRPLPDEVERLAASPQLASLRRLAVAGMATEDIGRFAASPHFGQLRELHLDLGGLGAAGMMALTEGRSLTGLEVLILSGTAHLEDYEDPDRDDPEMVMAGLEVLATWKHLAQVRSLSLTGGDVRAGGLRALLRSSYASSPKHLALRDGRLLDGTMQEFTFTPAKFRLETLDLGENVLGDGVEQLATAPCLSELRSLKLDRCDCTAAGARELMRYATFLGTLRHLDVSHNHFGRAGLVALLDRQPAELHTLRLRDNNLGDEGVAILAASPAARTLIELT